MININKKPIRKCNNRCIFCFIEQLPPNLRESLYLKDDDYIESFKHGNFITLTNITNYDLDNIIKYELSPLYISFHSANNTVREKLFGTKKHKKSLEILEKLDDFRIRTNIQIVVCPGINDGEDLINTFNYLIRNLKNIISIGVVPVGITKYNKCELLIPFDKEKSLKLINLVESYKVNSSFKNIYLADEFFIMADLPFPNEVYYGDFPQIENGIGLCVDFRRDFNDYLNSYNFHIKAELFPKNKNILVLTSEYSYTFLRNLINNIELLTKNLNLNLNINFNVIPVKNVFLGGNVKVTGLLTYSDYQNFFQNEIKKNELTIYDKILIPSLIFSKDNLTLDNKNQKDFKSFSSKIKFVQNNGKALAKELLDI